MSDHQRTPYTPYEEQLKHRLTGVTPPPSLQRWREKDRHGGFMRVWRTNSVLTGGLAVALLAGLPTVFVLAHTAGHGRDPVPAASASAHVVPPPPPSRTLGAPGKPMLHASVRVTGAASYAAAFTGPPPTILGNPGEADHMFTSCTNYARGWDETGLQFISTFLPPGSVSPGGVAPTFVDAGGAHLSYVLEWAGFTTPHEYVGGDPAALGTGAYGISTITVGVEDFIYGPGAVSHLTINFDGSGELTFAGFKGASSYLQGDKTIRGTVTWTCQ